jgi:S-adenosylmethionine-diacylgycerolhomoserine-N-methlytransferase
MSGMGDPTAPAAASMDRIYRYQRHIYDATRRNFLLGRDALVTALRAPDGATVVEVGCGTARNLIQAARAYPRAKFYGFDISAVMLETAQARIASAGLADRIKITQSDATNFDLKTMFGLDGADRIFISYALSMIPPWQQVLDCASGQLAPHGSLHVVDFGQLEGYPKVAKASLYAWLGRFEVHPSPELPAKLRQVADARGLDLTIEQLYRGYATLAALRRA